MAVLNLFSKRKKDALKAGQADVYSYDIFPPPLRIQIAHILRDAMGDYHGYGNDAVIGGWQFIEQAIAREKGLFQLGHENNLEERCIRWFIGADVDDALDMTELCFRAIKIVDGDRNEYQRRDLGIKVSAIDAIEELNTRFKEHSVGYRFESGHIIRIDSKYIHAEITKPALSLLLERGFETANQEFLAAHRHFRSGENKDCIVACQRAFESTLKAICTIKKWKFEKGDRISELIKLVRAKKLFPDYLDAGFDTYIAMLKTGLPGVRNNAGGHGSSPNERPVPEYLAAYALHMTATNIVLAVEAFKA